MKYKNIAQLIIKPISGLLLSIALFCGQTLWQHPTNTAHAYTTARHGHVVARGLFKGPNGENIFAVIGPKGEVIEEIGEAIGTYQDAVVMDAGRYNAILLTYQNTKSQLGTTAKGATVLSRNDYTTTNFGSVEVPLSNLAQGATTTTESVAISKGELYGQSKSVLVRANSTIVDPRLLPKAQGNILFQAPIDLRQATVQPDTIKSVLLNKDGQIIQTSEYNIGFKSNFFEDSTAGFFSRNAIGPVIGAEVDVGIRTLVPGFTDDRGIYGMFMTIPGCGLISYFWDFYITAKVNYRDFDPEAPEPIDYYWFGLKDYEQCSPSLLGHASLIGISRGGSRDILVDLIMLTGLGGVQNPNGPAISEGPTQYAYSAPPLAKVAPNWLDLNQDRNTDAVSQPDSNGNVNVWLDGNTTNPDGTPKAPDFTRLADTAPDFTNQGLLQSISAEDLEKTDIYVYRVSNGTLVVKKKGMRPSEIISKDNGFHYNIWVPGPLAFSYFGIGNGGTSATRDFQEAIGLAPELIGLNTDNLRAGEKLKLIAINRATGYMGSVTTVIESPSDGYLDFPIDKLVLAPPNLKIKVDRIYNIQAGLSQGDKKEYQIGFEGSALTSDTLISIHTEWFEPDGTPLPETLEGFTGRLAKVTGANSLAGGAVNTFEITPGSHRQVVKLEGDVLGTEHFYVHVFGVPDWETLGTGAGDGPLQFRPKNYVPVRVPIFDEVATTKLRNLNAYNQQDGLTGVEKVPAVYQWPYRPEMQFSVFELTVNQLEIKTADGQTTTISFSNAFDPELLRKLLADDVDMTKLLYDIASGNNNPLAPLGAERELVYSLGGEEALATINTNGTVSFADMSHLSKLNGGDILAIRLYQNSDSENVLWEYGFLNLAIAVDLNRDGKVEFASSEYLDANNTLPSDKTTTLRPYRFWVNNDLDVVNNSGFVDLFAFTCPPHLIPEPGIQNEQVCEQWDEDPLVVNATNTSTAERRRRIESYRDLEDFSPLQIRLGSQDISDKYYLVLKAVGVGVNLFKGSWRDDGDHMAHEYIYDHDQTVLQERTANESGGHVVNLIKNNTADERRGELYINTANIKEYFDQNGVGRFIFEGVTPSESTCSSNSSGCYLSIALYEEQDGAGSIKITERRVYLDMHDVKDYYQHVIAGNVVDPGSLSGVEKFNGTYNDEEIRPFRPTQLYMNIYKGLFPEADLRKNYSLLVHGWRMRESEKIGFAETSYKRLYWSGYKGYFGTLTWPTAWFKKPGHVYSTAKLLLLVEDNEQNYNSSESIARRVGPRLTNWLSLLKGSNKYDNIHVIAHSMGNVVVSEALRHNFSGSPILTSFTASNAAEGAGSYDQLAQSILHAMVGPAAVICPSGPYTAEAAWRCYNSNIGTAYDMPPDVYRYAQPANHGPTSDIYYETLVNRGLPYYENIKSQGTRIINFWNRGDAALNAWEFNQLTKPDLLGGPTWNYSNELLDCINNNEPVDCATTYQQVSDSYFRATTELQFNRDSVLTIDGAATNDTSAILAHIIPYRTNALGQVESDITSNEILSGFTNSNQDHSAQFHGYYSERRGVIPFRAGYWNNILQESFAFDSDTDYSGLVNGIGLKQ
jgi:hypothetical protein